MRAMHAAPAPLTAETMPRAHAPAASGALSFTTCVHVGGKTRPFGGDALAIPRNY